MITYGCVESGLGIKERRDTGYGLSVQILKETYATLIGTVDLKIVPSMGLGVPKPAVVSMGQREELEAH